jgi:hypothetical protein
VRPWSGHEILGLVAVHAHHGEQRTAGQRGVDKRLHEGHHDPQRPIEAVEGVGEAVHQIADDDARAMHRDRVEEVGRLGLRLGDDLAPLVIVARGLADVEFTLEHPAVPQPADVSAGDVMKPTDPGVTAESKHVSRAVHVAGVGLAVGLAAGEDQAGGGVHQLADVGGGPVPLLGRQAQPGGRKVAFEHHGAGDMGPGHLLPVTEQLVDAFRGVGRLARSDDHRHAATGGGQVTDERAAQQTGRSGDERIGIGGISAWHASPCCGADGRLPGRAGPSLSDAERSTTGRQRRPKPSGLSGQGATAGVTRRGQESGRAGTDLADCTSAPRS